MARVSPFWQMTAGYLYTLTLANTDLGWEYLRRNAAYRHNWRESNKGATAAARYWGCAILENPDQDARTCHPIWVPTPSSVVRLALEEQAGDTGSFSLWRVPARKTLIHDGHSIRLRCEHAQDLLQLEMPAELYDGAPFGYRLRSGAGRTGSYHAIGCFERQLAASGLQKLRVNLRQSLRAAVLHLRTLQACDGAAAGASHREIATVLFGPDAVRRAWVSDGELRAQVRYLLRRGAMLSSSGYRRLVGICEIPEGETEAPTDSP